MMDRCVSGTTCPTDALIRLLLLQDANRDEGIAG